MIIAFLAALAPVAPSTAQVANQVDCESRAGADSALCLAISYSKSGRPAEAAAQFEAAAQAAQGSERDRALAAAGNMWIAARQPGKAAAALDRALSGTGLQAEQRGEALLDRARVAEAQNDLKTARAKLNEAAATISGDPFYWYFNAALAIREGDQATAQTAIDKALALAPGDPTVLFEAGHVAFAGGDEDKARGYWMRAAAGDPTGPTGKAAAKAAEMLGVTPSVKLEPQPPK